MSLRYVTYAEGTNLNKVGTKGAIGTGGTAGNTGSSGIGDPKAPPGPVNGEGGSSRNATNTGVTDGLGYNGFNMRSGEPSLLAKLENDTFTVTPDNQGVVVSWTTLSEPDTAGFNILRNEEGGGYEKIAQVSSTGDATAGEVYNYTDKDVEQGMTYSYKLESVNDFGIVDGIYGPVRVTVE
jgi:hypothetical protein